MAKRGRKNKYETHVKPFFPEIMEMCRTMTEAQIAEQLGIGASTFAFYKSEFPELSEVLKKGKRNLVADLRGALIKRAMGFSYKETKTVTERIKLPDGIKEFLLENGFAEDELGKSQLIKTEVTNKHALPDVAALNLALKNYDSENWANDPQILDLKKQELELRKQQIENNSW